MAVSVGSGKRSPPESYRSHEKERIESLLTHIGKVMLCGKLCLSIHNSQELFTHHCFLGTWGSGEVQHIRGNLEAQFRVLTLP